MRRNTLFGLILVIGLIAAGCDFGRRPAQKMTAAPEGNVAEGVTVNKRAPDITGVDADGVSFRLSDYRGKIVLLDFWFES
jgi:cytochrome oxidase Cu insertion factor (SCO1/SenC/PrrC family)